MVYLVFGIVSLVRLFFVLGMSVLLSQSQSCDVSTQGMWPELERPLPQCSGSVVLKKRDI